MNRKNSKGEALLAGEIDLESGHGLVELPDLSGVDSIDSLIEKAGGMENLYKYLAESVECLNGERLPSLTVRYRNVSVHSNVLVRTEFGGVATLASVAKNVLGGPCAKKERQELYMLKNITGVLKPSRLTLILGRPGCGKTSYLKLMRQNLDEEVQVEGEVDFNGEDSHSFNLHMPTVAGYVTQRDIHLPTLTVKETLQFAHQCVNGLTFDKDALTSDLHDEQFRRAREMIHFAHRFRAETVIKTLGLENCQNTIIGNAMLRGVSGGEKKRVTSGEILVGRSRLLLMDEISTGLDSAATYDIVRSLKRACETFKANIVIALLQPPPEVFDLFDDILLLYEGHVIYHGPRDQVVPYMSTLGYQCPPTKDQADFLVEVTSKNRDKFISTESAQSDALFPASADDFAKAWEASELFRAMKEEAEAPWHGESTEFVENRPKYALNFAKNQQVVLKRQWMLTSRNRMFILVRTIMVLVAGLLYGSTFFDANFSLPQVAIGSLFACLMFVAMGQASQISTFFDYREVFYKQKEMNFMRTTNFILSLGLCQLPFAIMESLVFGNIVYWMIGFSATAGQFLFYFLTLVTINLAMTFWFFFLVAAVPNLTLMQPLSMVSILFFVVFAGFTILRDLIPSYWIWMYYLSPIQWGITALAINEYTGSRYEGCEYDGINYCNPVTYPGVTSAGQALLEQMQFPTEYYMKWISIIVLCAYFVIFIALAAIFLEKRRYHAQVFVTKEKEEDKKDPLTKEQKVGSVQRMSMKDVIHSYSSVLEKENALFKPVTLTFSDLWYTVKVKNKDGQTEDKALLKGVNGYALPGTMTALMGSSGAGKTTLMDVIAHRKSGGKIDGRILLNGYEADTLSIRRATGYCEQMDIHSPSATVREALIFSARLRQESSVSEEQKMKSVAEAIDLLELDDIADRVINGMSVEQMKRLTIGVELVASPSVLFLDEPTSGLDARAAKIIMRGVRNIANSGRTVVCTIHQPSTEVFFLFDNLLLLKRGGETVFFGPIGEQARDLVAYLESIPGTPKLKENHNPATYMLEVIGAGVGNSNANDYHQIWKDSALNESLMEHMKEPGLTSPSPSLAQVTFTRKRAATPGAQFKELFMRFARLHWRSPSYNFARYAVMTFLGLLFLSIYADSDFTTYQGVMSGIGLIFLTSLFLGMVAFQSVLPVMFAERQAFYRERSCETYNSLWFYVNMVVLELPYVLSGMFINSVIYYFGVGFSARFGDFIYYWLVASSYVLCMLFFGHLFVGFTPNLAVASITGAFIFIIVNLFAGFNPPEAAIPSYFVWIYKISPAHYGVAAQVALQFGYCPSPGGDEVGCQTVTGNRPPIEIDGQQTLVYTVSELVTNFYGMAYEDRYSYVGCLWGISTVVSILSAICLRYINHTTR